MLCSFVMLCMLCYTMLHVHLLYNLSRCFGHFISIGNGEELFRAFSWVWLVDNGTRELYLAKWCDVKRSLTQAADAAIAVMECASSAAARTWSRLHDSVVVCCNFSKSSLALSRRNTNTLSSNFLRSIPSFSHTLRPIEEEEKKKKKKKKKAYLLVKKEIWNIIRTENTITRQVARKGRLPVKVWLPEQKNN